MIRRATPADLPEITRIRTSVRQNHLTVGQMAERGITEQSITAAMRTGDLAAWVAESGGHICGFAMVEVASGKLFALFVHPDHEGRGQGSALLARAEDHLRAHGAKRMFLDTGEHTDAVRYYLNRGFCVRDRRGGDVFMEKTLTPQ